WLRQPLGKYHLLPRQLLPVDAGQQLRRAVLEPHELRLLVTLEKGAEQLEQIGAHATLTQGREDLVPVTVEKVALGVVPPRNEQEHVVRHVPGQRELRPVGFRRRRR